MFIFSVVKYIRDLKKDDCSCSKSWKRTAMNIYAWLSIILLIFSHIFLGIKAQESVRETHGFTDWSFGFGLGSYQI